MKKLFACICLMFSVACFANCELAPPTTSSTFCAKFKEIAYCHCIVDGKNKIPPSKCSDMNFIYKMMLSTYGSQDNACKYQESHGSPQRTSAAQCNKDWDCYRLGTGQCYKKCM